ncbi:MAG: DJ-1/PfpI family protein [Sphingomonadaceae bacterium]
MQILFLLYPDVTQLDLTGPAQVLARMPGARLDFAWKTRDAVMSDCNLALVPTVTLEEAPQADLLVVPGGYGCTDMMNDPEVLGWLRRQSEGAQWVTSVCTGSLVLAAAGLLRGVRAGCHWAWGEHLAKFGASFVAERTVIDGRFMTAGGVTSGIDFAFRLIAEIHGRDVAEAIQLALEYDPQPLGGGTPETARPEVKQMLLTTIAPRMAARREAIDRAAQAVMA